MRPITRFWKDRRGNFGVMTAFLLVPLIGTAGMALDFGHALTVKQQLVGAADAAAVGAIAEKSKAVAQAMQLQGDGSVSLDPAEARGIFLGQMSGELSTLPVSVDIDVLKTNGVLTSRVSFSATLPTAFMTILGKDDITVSGQATAQYQTPSFLDFYMLLDNTPSMGVGATPADVAKLRAATINGRNGKDKDCAFACHIVSESGVEDTGSYYNLAKTIGATIRIDVVADAVAALMSTAKETQTVTGQFRMAAYTFGQTALDAKLFTVANPTTDFDALSKATQKIQLMSIPSHDYPNNQTDYNAALTGISDKIKSTGGGTSSADRQAIVFLVGDGVGDAQRANCKEKLTHTKVGSEQLPRCMEPIDVQYCNDIKLRGVKIAVLYTTYLPLPENSFYNSWIAPFQPKIPNNMQACATEGYYFEVSPTEGIAAAMNTLFRKIVSTPRITS
ncbi:Flp pilus assembly protein TadG [Neorhizobium sp. 2083]|uniref:TadE/TadG family type IV pilus assembly protein n=1 Tax=Neorhizobium sp. 2083 TaxID=2817762 RepID=UPI0028671ABC|nr:pilus assembly protein [Neorhizobium sp. 2083]MDR6818869.1 Flp pilus assembly protein TadG [Neorhizobium sp. 2083]